MDILIAIAMEDNMVEIVEELREYATDIDKTLAIKAMQAMGAIAQRLESALDMILHHLCAFLEQSDIHMIGHAIMTIRDVLRTYPTLSAEEIVDACVSTYDTVESPEAQAAICWMVGYYADLDIPSAPYILEHFVNDYSAHPILANALLTASLQVFFCKAC